MNELHFSSIDSWIKYWSKYEDKVAFIDTDHKQWSYKKLNIIIDNIAYWLQMNGIGQGSIVIVCIENLFFQRLMRFSINRCKAIDAIIYPKVSSMEFKERIEIIKPDLVVVEDEIDEIRSLRFPIELLSQDNVLKPQDLSNVNLSHRILFTTGTTGKAKAVLLSEDRLHQVAQINIKERQLKDDDILLSVLPIYHAAGSLFEDSFIILGGKIILCNNSTQSTFYTNLKEHPASVTTITPSFLLKMFCYEDFNILVNKLRLINLAGEKIGEKVLYMLKEVYKGIITRGYGMTEAGPFIALLLEERLSTGKKINSVGYPIAGVEVKLQKKSSENVGVLFVKSPYLMVCYYNDETATNMKIENGWLNTEDIARIEEGQIFILGRVNRCIKSGGELIHPYEIECVLDENGEFDEVVVIGIESNEWGERPVAFYTSRKKNISSDNLVDSLSNNLSKFKWPDYVIRLDEMPKNHVGKIDYNGLKKIFNELQYKEYLYLNGGLYEENISHTR